MLSALSAGDYRTQLHAKAAAVAAALAGGGYDFAFLHVKAVDDTGHDRDTVLKVGCSVCCFTIKNRVRADCPHRCNGRFLHRLNQRRRRPSHCNRCAPK